MNTQYNTNESTAMSLRGSAGTQQSWVAEAISQLNCHSAPPIRVEGRLDAEFRSIKRKSWIPTFVGMTNNCLTKTRAGLPRPSNSRRIVWIFTIITVFLCLPVPAHAVPIGTLSVGQKTGDFSLGFGIDYKMRRVNYDGYDTDMATKGFSAAARYSIISSLTVFADAGFADVSLSNPNFQGYMGFSYGGGIKLSVPDPHRSRYTINFDADVYNVQSGNSVKNANDFEYSGAIYAAFKNANTITYGGLQASNVDLSFTSPNQDYHSKYNVGALFGMDEFITPFLFFNFEVHVFDVQSVEGSMGYEFF